MKKKTTQVRTDVSWRVDRERGEPLRMRHPWSARQKGGGPTKEKVHMEGTMSRKAAICGRGLREMTHGQRTHNRHEKGKNLHLCLSSLGVNGFGGHHVT